MSRVVAVLGSDLAAAVFAVWLRKLDPRATIRLLSGTRYPGCPRSCLPYVVSGDLEPRDAPLVYPETLSTALAVELVEGDDLDGYDVLVLSTGTRPSDDCPLCDFTLTTVEDAVRLREYLEGREGAELTVAGGFHGIQLLDALDRLGVKARLLSQGNPFLEHFDPDMAGIALERAGITLTDEPGGTVVCFGMEAPRVPGWINGGRPLPVDHSMRYDRRVYALGPVALIRDNVSGRMFSHLSDELSIRQGMAAALSVAGHPVRIRFTKLAVARFSGTLFASCGLTSAEARAAGMDPAVTRVAFGEGPGRSYLKLVADRRDGRLVGAQFVGDPARHHLVEMVYGFVVLGREVGELLSAVDLIEPDTPAPFYGPLGKAVHALWRKMLPE